MYLKQCVYKQISCTVVVLRVCRDDPELWLRKVDSSSVEMLIVLFPLMWRQGIGMELMREGGEYSSFLFIFQDQNHTVNFLSFLTGNIFIYSSFNLLKSDNLKNPIHSLIHLH